MNEASIDVKFDKIQKQLLDNLSLSHKEISYTKLTMHLHFQ